MAFTERICWVCTGTHAPAPARSSEPLGIVIREIPSLNLLHHATMHDYLVHFLSRACSGLGWLRSARSSQSRLTPRRPQHLRNRSHSSRYCSPGSPGSCKQRNSIHSRAHFRGTQRTSFRRRRT
ncbi:MULTISPECIES: nickel-dependent hydrogenase large subunit [Bradyrhizobium]|uniref:Nickel-dependent hydrogenase large subunit n=1 Tax=Bradyrhizobium zhengyangense TaxID=2911009 RepID=A0A9X1UF47_9BRAD|nr:MULTISPECIES: nickel-dependent hydrogenase large subunit [Bradyrhizobium]MCG2633119.1 nickel-dependent hydrogenase large subunit [Bradyrhizobium zhengyangense]MCG2645687.1 nickel-dependent hydrogenase large subunit [Bradyrhizobium zhengyangense]MDN4985466.1 nickel-dependent hydrogenase large subunit [Bradyrhizobium sp. WYCCWR 13022]MDN5006231.1 nickel-dependent hydrogenase large subunit [Bradyrhizobium sp. WYCCWR 12677]